jgi:hypothetical protein
LSGELIDEIGGERAFPQDPGDVLDHSNGFFAGGNNLIQKIGGSEPTTIEEFVRRHRAAFDEEYRLAVIWPNGHSGVRRGQRTCVLKPSSVENDQL